MGGGAEDLREDHLIFRGTKGGSVVTENPKGGITEKFGKIRRGTIQICLENEDIGGGECHESHQKLLGGSFQ